MKPGRLSRHAFEILLAILAATLPTCGAPPSVPLKGGAADAVARGISSGTGRFDHGRFSRVLKAHIRDAGARFDYASLKDGPEDFQAYLGEVGKVDLPRLSREELLALLINAYNAYTIQTILDTLTPQNPRGVGSIRDIPEVFDRSAHLVGGFRLSLNNIEHNLIRPLFKDPRIHFAVNCASLGCPPLPEEAFTGERVESQLEAAARRVLSSPRYVRVEEGRLRVIRLFDWYRSDFLSPEFRGSSPTLPRFIHRYASDDVRTWIDAAGGDPAVAFLDYDWSLNRWR